MIGQLLLLALFCASVSAVSEFKQVIEDDSIFVGLQNHGNYAIASEELKQFNWASVDVNGDQVRIVTPECHTIEKNIQDTGENERRLLASVAKRLDAPGSRIRISFDDGEYLVKGSSILLSETDSFDSDGVSMQKINDKHYTVSTRVLARSGIKRLSIDDDLVTFIMSDRSIRMQPRACLDKAKDLLMEDVRAEISQAKWSLDQRRLNEPKQPARAGDDQTKKRRPRELLQEDRDLLKKMGGDFQQSQQAAQQQVDAIIKRLDSERGRIEQELQRRHEKLIEAHQKANQLLAADRERRHAQLVSQHKKGKEVFEREREKRHEQLLAQLDREYKALKAEQEQRHQQLIASIEKENETRREEQKKRHEALVGQIETDIKSRRTEHERQYAELMANLEKENDMVKRSEEKRSEESINWLIKENQERTQTRSRQHTELLNSLVREAEAHKQELRKQQQELDNLLDDSNK